MRRSTKSLGYTFLVGDISDRQKDTSFVASFKMHASSKQ